MAAHRYLKLLGWNRADPRPMPQASYVQYPDVRNARQSNLRSDTRPGFRFPEIRDSTSGPFPGRSRGCLDGFQLDDVQKVDIH